MKREIVCHILARRVVKAVVKLMEGPNQIIVFDRRRYWGSARCIGHLRLMESSTTMHGV
jgi:hypothetical protein